MQRLKFEFKDSAVLDANQIIHQATKLIPEIEQIRKCLEKKYAKENRYSSSCLC